MLKLIYYVQLWLLSSGKCIERVNMLQWLLQKFKSDMAKPTGMG